MKNLLLLILLFISLNVQAQYRMGLIPRVSPTQDILNTIGYTEVGIHYSSPSVKNRDIWGDLVPYGKIWRAGANEATRLTFSKNVLIGGKEVPSGSYALFIIPRKHGKWTVILNEVADQWGAFSYDSNKDVLRMDVLPRFNISYEEKLRYEVVDIGFEYGIIRMQWENVELEIEFMTQFIDNFINKIQTTTDTMEQKDQWVVYLQGAEFLAERKQRLDTAASWISMAENKYLGYDHAFRKNESYYLGHIYWVKALVSEGLNDHKEALESINKIKELDSGRGYYSRSNNKDAIDLLEQQILEVTRGN